MGNSIKSRVEELRIIFKAKSIRQLANILNIHYQSLYDIGRGAVKRLSRELTDKLEEHGINPEWLETGSGTMFLEEPQINKEPRGVPYYEIDAFAHIGEGFEDKPAIPSYYINFQPFNDCTAYVNVYGDSMLPEYKNGDIIAIKEITNKSFIIWGETYLIITNSDYNNMKLLKNIYQHEDNNKIILRSINPEYTGDIIIGIDGIQSLFIVVGKITKKNM